MISIFNGSMRGLSNPHETTTFIQVHHSILKHMHGFTASEWMVFTALALRMDVNGFCFPSIEGIAKSTGLSDSTVRRCLGSLQKVTVNGMRVLSVRERFDSNGRQTSNGYILFPDCEEGVKNIREEGVKSEREEGVKNDTPINNNKKEQEPQGTTYLKRPGRSSIKLPNPDDPGRLLYEAYRSIAYPELEPSNFNLAEWAGARHIVYQMNHKGITPQMIEHATGTLIRKWGGNRDIVTIHALWKHWSTATTGAVVNTNEQTRKTQTPQELGMAAADIFRKVTGQA